ncbi:MAG: hypothetical protein RML40_01160 [Bacteroidota bacterium]|nr:hypothetical protein [Candidatus Kapabacteria bacterium]MDW8219117.1 hypothetical protein [Bacteroidota bacterium]
MKANIQHWSIGALVALAVLSYSTVHSVAQDVKAACATVDNLLEEGKVAEARKALDAVYNAGIKDYEWLWRSSRVMLLQADLENDNAKKEAMYYEAKRLADEALKLNPNGMYGYIRRAAASGKVALTKGVLGAAEQVKSAREDAEKAIALNNATPQALAAAHYILGRTHLKLSETAKAKRMLVGLGWGNLDDALKHLKKAVDLRGDFIMYNLEYAKALAANNQFAEAKQYAQKAAGGKEMESGDAARKAEANALLKEWAAK